MLAQLRQRLAAGEAEILDDEIALAQIGRCIGHAAGDIETAQQMGSTPLSSPPSAAACVRHTLTSPQPCSRLSCRPPAVSSLAPCPKPPAGEPEMKENFRQFLDRLRQAGELVDLHQAVDIRHIATLVDQAKTALYFHNVIGYDMPVVSGIIRSRERAMMAMGCENFGEIEHKLAGRDRQADPAEAREELADPRGHAGRRRRRSLQAADPDVVDLRRRADDHRRRRDRARSGARHELRHLPLHRQGKGPHRHRHRHAEQHAAVRAARVRGRAALPISISIGTHPFEITGSGYRAPLGVDEMAIAGGLRGEAVELAPC